MFFHKALLVAGTVGLASLAEAQSGTKYLFTFGDSYTTTGFNPSGTKPSAQNPIGNPKLPGTTLSGGLNWPGYLATQFNGSTVLAYNFAVSGAVVDKAIVPGYSSGIPSFVDQMGQWQSSGVASKPSWAPWTSQNTLAGAFFGINDILSLYWQGQDPPVSRLVDRYFQQFQALYNAGVRNFFIMTVPPVDRSPQLLSQSSSGKARVVSNINNYNSALASRLATFKSQNSGVTAMVITTATPFNMALNNPRNYGAPDATCYNSNGASCLWWDNLHPGLQIQKLMAQAVATAWKGSFFRG